MPNGAATVSSASMISTGEPALPSSATGRRPKAEHVTLRGTRARERIAVRSQASSGMLRRR